jgi:hypothetical protein
MARRRRMPPKAQGRAAAPSEITGAEKGEPMNADNTHSENHGTKPHPGAEALAPASIERSEPNLHETLLEGVSADAIAAASVGDASHQTALAEPDAAEEPEATEPEADAAPLADDLTVVPEEAAEPVPLATETVEAVEAVGATIESVAEAVPETIAASHPLAEVHAMVPTPPAALPDLGPDLGKVPNLKVMDLAKAPRLAEVMGELGEANATVLSYLRSESTAALAHWQALSGAKTPADALRIQVDEMQRAADASLSCFAALAKRASQFTSVIGRS